MARKVIGPTGSRRRRWLFLWCLVVTVAGVVLFVGAAGGYPTGLSNLANGTFDAANGNLTPSDPGLHDWNPAGSPADGSNPLGPINPIDCGTIIPDGIKNCKTDLVSSSSDESLGQGTKEDDTSVSVVSGQIPSNKDDLSRFYLNHETVSSTDCGGSGVDTCHYLYLAWERSNLLGSAHLDFELNQNDPGITSTAGSQTLNRTPGDVLIDFDFGGSGTPTLVYHVWLDTGAFSHGKAADCEASTTYPCWGKGIALPPASYVATVNGSDVTDYNDPGAPQTLIGSTVTQQNKTTVSSTFGEAGINLEGAGIFTPGVCENIGSAWVKSRSSGSSFTSELKDFITPLSVNISNCGGITIKKVTVPSPDPTDTSFDFSAAGSNGGSTDTTSFSLANGDTQDLEKGGSTDIQAGDYTVTETPDSNFTLTDISCEDGNSSFAYGDGTTNTGTSFSDGDTSATISLAADDAVLCVFTNTQNTGAIQIHKVSSKGTDLAGASFTATASDGVTTYDFPATDASGNACVADLPFDTYTVAETAAPDGYSADANSQDVTVDSSGTCDSGYATPTNDFVDTPLTDVTVNVASQATGGTNSAVQCVVAGTTTDVGDSPQPDGVDLNDTSTYGDPVTVTADGLEPGTYTCTIVIDP